MRCQDCGRRARPGFARCYECAWRALGVSDPPDVPPGPFTFGRVPIYDEAGELFAESVKAAARRLSCTVPALYRHMAPDPEGGSHVLVSRPSGPRPPIPVVYGSRRWDSRVEAARDLGVSLMTIRINVTRDGDRAFILRRIPQPRKRERSL